jgi:hypothetical protein
VVGTLEVDDVSRDFRRINKLAGTCCITMLRTCVTAI